MGGQGLGGRVGRGNKSMNLLKIMQLICALSPSKKLLKITFRWTFFHSRGCVLRDICNWREYIIIHYTVAIKPSVKCFSTRIEPLIRPTHYL